MILRRNYKVLVLLILMMLTASLRAAAPAAFRGRVVDAVTGEWLMGVTVKTMPQGAAVQTDEHGVFVLPLERGAKRVKLQFTYLGYKRLEQTAERPDVDTLTVFRLEPLETTLGTATVKAQAQRNTEVAMVNIERHSLVVQSGVSAAQIAKTQDKDASEIIRRVPGISVIDKKFVMVRGLSQRYNNVWINGSAVPSSEADQRAFSFDVIPSSQVDNLQIVKSPAPEYPADFSGGFIKIETKEVPNRNTASLSIGASVNDRTHFRDFFSTMSSGTDFLGFDNGLRGLSSGIDTKLEQLGVADDAVSPLSGGLCNDWRVRKRGFRPDLNFSADINRSRETDKGALWAVLASLNYSNTRTTYAPMENALFGAYDLTHDCSVFMHRYTDRQYSEDARLGAMLNLTFVPAGKKGRYEWKNIFNQLGKSRYTDRTGIDAQSNAAREAEYYYNSRTVYNTQLTSKLAEGAHSLDWSVGYAFANRNMPDRRRYVLNDQYETGNIELYTANDINREFTFLKEHIGSAALNYRFKFCEGKKIEPELRVGGYGEYRSRDYRTRSFIYGFNPVANDLPSDFRNSIPWLLGEEEYLDEQGFYMLDDTKMRNDYQGRRLNAAGYAGLSLPIGAVNIYAGVRFEHDRMELISNTRDYEKSPMSKFFEDNDFFPSFNLTWRLPKEQQLRASYGRTINRPEFREVSPSVFYDFDLPGSVQGNTNLRSCHVDNADLRYEWYPAKGDEISLAAFVKNFNDPIEWTYTVAGGTDLVYSYQNADRAISLGLELDVRKNLGFIGLKDFTLLFNGSLIKSRVFFEDGSRQKNRPMQGQSPYLLNCGIFYEHKGWEATVLYNRIGKRLIGVGRSLGTTGDQSVNIPDSYEMPRNALDLSCARTFGKWRLRLGVKDVLAEKVVFKQFNDVTLADGTQRSVQEVTRSYRPGRSFSLSASYKF